MLKHIEPYLGVLIAIALAFFILTLPNSALSPVIPPEPTASSTITVVSDVILPAPSLLTIATSTSATTTKKVLPPAKPKQSAVAVTPTPVMRPAEPSYSSVDLDNSAVTLRNALVNIICYAPAGGPLHSITGSGIIIDSKGIILTNAHIAQYFLLFDRGISCTIRSGNPASNRYKASLIYIPEPWLRANAKVLTTQNPTGTGEQDFALLAITKSATSAPLPTVHPSIPLATDSPRVGTAIVIASYGAQFLQSAQVQSSLFPTIVFGSVKDVYTFASTTVDVLALGGSAAAQEGSSGGGVAGVAGTLLGTITTSTVVGDTSTRLLDAITATYIRRAYMNETGKTLDALLAVSLDQSVADFATKIPALEAILTAQLP